MTRLGLVALLLALSPAARGEDKSLKLRWYGQSFFQLETAGGKKVVFDPHNIPEFGRPQVSADVICVSHLHTDHAQLEAVENSRAARVFMGLKEPAKGRQPDWNRIDETVGGVRVRSLGTYHDAENGVRRGKNTVFVVEADGLVVCHLGDLGHELSPEQVRAIGPVDVLLVPIGGVYTLNGETAQAVMKAVKPRRLTVPMHYGVPGYDELLGPEQFLDGLPDVKRTPATNEVVIPLGPPAGPPQVVLPGWQPAGAKK
jgi:L-ascorbate metabolism protein UlaG (beta-lactamase superfamily)